MKIWTNVISFYWWQTNIHLAIFHLVSSSKHCLTYLTYVIRAVKTNQKHANGKFINSNIQALSQKGNRGSLSLFGGILISGAQHHSILWPYHHNRVRYTYAVLIKRVSGKLEVSDTKKMRNLDPKWRPPWLLSRFIELKNIAIPTKTTNGLAHKWSSTTVPSEVSSADSGLEKK